MSTARKELKLPQAQRELVNYSVRAQDYILRQGMNGFKTTDDLILGSQQFNSSVSYIQNSFTGGPGIANTNVTTNISVEDASRMLPNLNKSQFHDIADQLLLPSIKSVRKNNQQSPFKGFLDTSNFSKKMRSTAGGLKGGFDCSKSPMNILDISTHQMFKEEKQKMKESGHGHGYTTQNSAANRMNPKVLETWINETLQDAEHLDIPGVVLKPEHKNPISRYGIDRLALTNAGIPNEMVDRIFRALFVYSVGFYELVKKCLQHTEKKYTIITSIWKVFSILLEYCCKTDYRMLISEISKEHKQELEKLEKEFQAKFAEQAQNERILKQNMEILSKYNEELEKERTNERQMRLKLEEEYMQNTKNHEEEVQLRLKFESKLNNMHSVHRDLETKYKRCLNEIATLQNTKEQLTTKSNTQMEDITTLKTIKAEQESKLNYQEEKLNALQREIHIKVKQVEEYEGRYTKTQDELDLTKYKLQEANKDITELKLRIDVYDSQVDGLKNEKQHLQLELKETKDLSHIYEKKCGQLMDEINKVNQEFQVSKREIIGFGEIQKEREDRIDQFKRELRELKLVHEDLDLKHGTLSIQYEKVKEQYETCRRDLDDAIEKLHITNKVRHETEVRYHEEIDKNRTLHEIIKDKEEVMGKRAQEIEDLDRKVIELERMNEALEIKKAGVERQYELTKKQLNEKIINLNDVLNSEKETRETWIERYEKEQREHTSTNAQLLQTKSSHKDAVLQTKNAEIKLQTQSKANEVLTESNLRLQDQLNDTLARCENLERELNTQKEIMKQMEIAKKEYIQKLKRELDTVEARFYKMIDLNTLTSEDYHSRARENLLQVTELTAQNIDLTSQLNETQEQLQDRINTIEDLNLQQNRLEMQNDEYWVRLCAIDADRVVLTSANNLIKMKCENLQATNKNLKADSEAKHKYQSDYNEILKEVAKLKKEMGLNNKQSKGNLVTRSPGSTPQHSQQVEKKHTSCQTMLLGTNIEQMMHHNNNQNGSHQQAQSNDQLNKGQAQRVGGGGQIRKPERAKNQSQTGLTQQQQQQQHSQLSIGGDQSQFSNKPHSKGGSTMKVTQHEILTQNNYTKQSNVPNIYPQTATNQQVKNSTFSEQKSSKQRQVESQQASPRGDDSQLEFNPVIQSYQQQLVGEKKLGGAVPSEQQDLYSHGIGEDKDTMISNSHYKMSPDAHHSNKQQHVMQNIDESSQQQQYHEFSRDDADHNTMMSSLIMQSPEGTLNLNTARFLQQQQNNGYSDNNSQQFIVDQQTIVSSQHQLHHINHQAMSDMGMTANHYTLEEQQHNIIFQQNSIIHEQMGEDDEERKTPIPSQHRSQKMIPYSQGSHSQASRRSATREQMVIDYKGLNSVMKSKMIKQDNDSKKILNGTSTISVNIHNGSNESVTVTKQTHLSNISQMIINDYQSNDESIQQINETGDLKQQSTHIVGDEHLSQYMIEIEDSVLNTGHGRANVTENPPNGGSVLDNAKNYSSVQPSNKNRLKIDITNSKISSNNINDAMRLSNNMGGINNMATSNIQSSLMTPHSQTSLGLTQQSANYQTGPGPHTLANQNNNNNILGGQANGMNQQQYQQQQQQQQYNQHYNSNQTPTNNQQNGINFQNKQVKGKSSIRTLIKSAATRDK